MMGPLFTYVCTYGGALAALVNPFVALLAYICFAIIKPDAFWFWSVPPGNYSRILAIGLLCGWAIHGFGNWNFGRSAAVVWLLVGYMAWSTLSAILAPNQEVAWSDVEAHAKIVLPVVVGVTLIESVGQLKILAWVIMLSQGLLAYEANSAYLAGYNRMRENGFGAGDNNCAAIAMVCGAGFAFFLGLAEQKLWRRWLAFAIAAMMAHAIMISDSRGGMLALLITGVASFVLIRKQPVYYAYLLLAIVIGLRLAGPSVWERFNSSFAEEGQRDESAQSRVDLWNDCLRLMQSNPLFGVGPAHFPLVADSLGWTEGKEAHTLWLQTGAELGVPGLGLLFGFYLLAMLRLWKVARQLRQIAPDFSDSCRMVVASLLGFMIAAQFVSLAGLEIPYYVALVGAGYLKLSDPLLAAAYSQPFSPDLQNLAPARAAVGGLSPV
jgi:probable O-glycosylation ligase (exosortase A-associated)